MSIIAPSVTNRTVFEFIDGVTLALPRPVVDDVTTQQLTRINRQSRGLKRHLFIDPDWYKIVTYDYSFRRLTLAKKDEFLTFFNTRIGKPITRKDHLTISKTVYVREIAPVEEVRDDACSYTIGLIVQEVL